MPTAADLEAKAQAARRFRVEIARRDPGAFCRYVLKDEQNGKGVKLQPMQDEWHDLALTHERLIVMSHVESGKALALDTPIPTPDGWRNMGDLQVGDRVFAGDGSVTRVVFATGVQHDRTCYRVRFSDGAELVADADHRWLAWTDDRYAKGRRPQEVTTAEMLARGLVVGTKPRKHPAYRWRVPVAPSAEYPHRELPLHPYVLGAWLGDGDSTCGRLTYHPDDRYVFDRCLELTGLVGGTPAYQKKTVAVTQGIVARPVQGTHGGLTTRLRPLGVLRNKHIPDVYMRASEDQRLELLAGLLDTDGHAGPKNRVEFSSASTALGEQVLELARSLGFKAVLTQRFNHVRVTFTAWRQVFRLPRKAAVIKPRAQGKELAAKTVVAIDLVPSVPVRCIQVAHPDHTYLAGRSYTVTHNTQNLSIGHVLWTLGRDPNTRVVIVSNTVAQSMKIVRSLAEYIERSPELHEVFPDLLPDPRGPWNQTQLSVRRKGAPKDPSIQAIGVHGSIVGARIDLLILDDLLDYENTRTKGQRDDLWEWIHSTLFGRLTQHARVVSVGNAYHREDFLHRLEKNPLWVTRRYPVMAADGTPSWPERWPLERISRKRDELGPLEFARQMLCQARDDGEARFKREWIDTCLKRGNGRQLVSALATIPPGCSVYTGVDLAIQQHAGADLTVLFTILVHPDGTREVLNIESGRLAGPDIVAKIRDVHHRYQGIVFVENNAAQDFIVQFTRYGTAVPVRPFTTGRNKAHPEFGVEGMAAEMAGGKWVIPNSNGRMHPEVDAWCNEMLYYDPRSHTGDRLMASWLAREAARQGNIRAEIGFIPTLRR